MPCLVESMCVECLDGGGVQHGTMVSFSRDPYKSKKTILLSYCCVDWVISSRCKTADRDNGWVIDWFLTRKTFFFGVEEEWGVLWVVVKGKR
jgi:hypothetical protein